MSPRRSSAGRSYLRDLGEDVVVENIQRLVPADSRIVSQPGDDAAIVEAPRRKNLMVLKTDCVVERVHFDSKTAPELVGWKAMMRPLSDFAAMSALPEFALVTLVVSGNRTMDWVNRVYRGLARAGRRFGVTVAGGETSSTPGPAIISIAVTGQVEKERWVSRHGGKPGDQLFVTGRLGKSIAGKHLRFVARIEESRWLTANFFIHAMMDLSDGLGADLPRLAGASKVGFHIEAAVLPLAKGATVRNAIGDGEDYELLFAISLRDSNTLQEKWRKQFPRLPLTHIGRLNPRSAIKNPQLKGGYVHFR
jgi:thiamine-monophosphate kinase